MRGLIGAALVLAPALASALSAREVDFDHELVRDLARVDIDRLYTQISVEIPEISRSPDEWSRDPLAFRLQILRSEAACGYGNVTVDGHELPQTLTKDVSRGSGTFTGTRNTLVASWEFHCIRINGVPDSQFMKFYIDLLDGRALQNIGFSTLFRQAGPMEIMNVETDLSIPDQIAANPNPQALQPVDEDIEFPQYSIEDDMAELDWMLAQLRELEYLIFQKEEAIRQHASQFFEQDIEECDNLKCVVQAVAEKARHAAHHLYGKIAGDTHAYEEFDGPHFKKPHFPKPPFKRPHFKFPKPPFHGGKNCTGPPKGNHTHPGKPHFPHHPLPICRYPPPPHHGKPGKPPHHGKPPHGKPPGPPHKPDFHHGPDMDGPPSPHSDEDFNDHRHGQGRENQGPPPESDIPNPDEGHHRGPPPEFDHSPGELHGYPPPPPPDFAQEQLESPDHRLDRPHGPHGHPPEPPPFHGPKPPGLVRAFHIIKFIVIGCLLSFLVLALHRRANNPARRADREARRERKEKRRALRRAIHKHAITRLLARISGNQSDSDDEDYEEKRQRLLSDAEDGVSTTMSEDIEEMRNAAEVFGAVASVSPSPPQAQIRNEPVSIPAAETTPLVQDFELGSQVGEGEELPAYEDNDGSEDGSMIADGFRYTPGSSAYSPSHSPAGSVRDILGPDTKN